MRGTREKIMDAAERCFSRQGITAASIRTITKEAGVNLGAVTYHFGSKDNLVIEVFKRRMLPMSQKRLAMLDAARKKAGERPLSLREVVEAIVIPQRRVAEKHPEYIEFLRRMKTYPNPKFYKIIEKEFKVIFQVFDQALMDALPPMSAPEFHLKMFFFIHLLESVPKNNFRLRKLLPNDLNDDAVTEAYVSFIVGGLSTPLNVSQPFSGDRDRGK